MGESQQLGWECKRDDWPWEIPASTQDTMVQVTVWPGYAKLGTIPVPVEPVCQALRVYPYPCSSLLLVLITLFDLS